jgi:hypothetical protein
MEDATSQQECSETKAGQARITEAQSRTAAGSELLAVCRNLLEDQSISPDEVWDLGMWLESHRDSNLPAIEFLADTVLRTLVDGEVTSEECNAVLDAITTVLAVQERP